MLFAKNILIIACLGAPTLTAIGQPDTSTALLWGRWELLEYSEQGVQVNKKEAATGQAITVYQFVKKQRAAQWYGFFEEYGERRTRAYERWEERDSMLEVSRIAEAIAMPYFAVFFPDSTLALYNKDEATQRVYFPESRHYVFSPKTSSIDIFQPGGYAVQWQAQIMELTRDRLVLFLPEDGERVVLRRKEGEVP
jgi:hypothetical protein